MRHALANLVWVVLVCVPGLTSAQGANPWLERRVLNIAHRGGRAEAPEHTMYAYKTALPKLVTTLEIDVQRSLDGVLVVHHDGTVDRVTDGSGPVESFTLAELKALDNAYWYAPVCGGVCQGQPDQSYVFRGVASGASAPPAGFTAQDFQILTMREVLETFPDILMSIEIKGEAPASVPAAEQLADLLLEFGRTSDVMIASFDDATTAAFKARAPEIHTTPGLAEVLAFVGQPGPLPDHIAFQVPRTFEGIEVAPLIIDPAHANGLAVYFFIDPDEETEEVYNELIDAGADGIITDEPTALQAVLEQRGAAFHHDQPAALKVALVKSSRALKFVSRRAFASPRVAPPETASSLSVDANGGNMTDPLTAGSWKLLGKPEAPKGWKYVNPNAPVGGACKVVLVKATSLKAVCKDKGSIPDPLPPTMNGDVLMSLSLGIDRYCVAAQAPHAVEKAGAVIKAKDQPAPPGCDAP